jgi:hypothetical protein
LIFRGNNFGILLGPQNFMKAANERLFLMKDLAAVEEAMGLGAKSTKGKTPSEIMWSSGPSASG